MTFTMRLNKYLAHTGACSRREADKLIADGAVKVNGQVVREMGVQINPATDFVTLKNAPVRPRQDHVYVRFHKPRGILTSYGDPKGRPNLENVPFLAKNRFAYSGRLDYNSEGLIIFSSDGDFIQAMQHPNTSIEKEYIATVNRELTEAERRRLEKGVTVQGVRYRRCTVDDIGDNEYRVVITEGKYRQVRNMFAAVGVLVMRLIRIRVGNIRLDGLAEGRIDEIPLSQIEELKSCIASK